MKRRLLSMLLTVCMMLTMLPTAAFATDIAVIDSGDAALCEHHTQHDEACGYVMAQAAVEGVSCSFACEECAAADHIPADMILNDAITGYEAKTTEHGDFSVTTESGDTPAYSTGTLTLGSGTYVVAMKSGVTTTTNKIVVSSSATAKITLDGVNIDVSGQYSACAFDMSGATVALTLANGSNNSLKSGGGYAGLQVPTGATLTIDGAGGLTAQCGGDCAGIGGGQNGAGGTISITGGTVTAKSSSVAAMFPAPTLGSGTTVTASGKTDGSNPVEEYKADNIATYKYLKVNTLPPPPDLTVTFDGTTTGYVDFASAWAAAIDISTGANAKATITLNKDVSATAPFSNNEDYLVLDTNGHTLDFGSFSGNSRITNNGGSLEVIGSGKITGSSGSYIIGVLGVTNGTVKVTDATIQNTGTNASVAVVVNGGEFHFIRGKLISSEEYALCERGNAKIYLYSGTIQSSGRSSLSITYYPAVIIMPSDAPLILINQKDTKIAFEFYNLDFSKVEITDLKYGASADGTGLTTKSDNVYDATVNASGYVTITKKARPITAVEYAATSPAAAADTDYVVDNTKNPKTLTIKTAKGAAWWCANGASYLGYSVKLAADIDVSDFLWSPVGTNEVSPFTGIFDGQGHSITGLVISEKMQYAGIFGVTSNATIKNVGLVSSSIEAIHENSGDGYAGGITGLAKGGTIANCFNGASVTLSTTDTGSFANVGGIVGFCDNVTLENCYSFGKLTATTTKTNGALKGDIFADCMYEMKIESCFFLESDNDTRAGTTALTEAQMKGASGSTDALIDKLNTWVDSSSSGGYYTWKSDSITTPANSGYPLFHSLFAKTNAITASTASNGSYTVKVDNTAVTKAAEGATVVITPTANSGYELSSITYSYTKSGDTKETTVAVGATENVYSFSMLAYAVTVNVSFKKTPTASDFTFTAPASLVYSGSGKSATVTAASSVSGMGTITVEYYSGATKLSSAPTDIGDYTVKINVAAGDSYAAATGITDSSWAFTVTAKAYTSSDFNIGTIANQTYTGSEIKPALEIKLGDNTLVSGTDYILSYSDNTNAGDSAKVAIELKGNFSGKAEKTFTILPLDISAGATVGDFNAMTYSGTEQTPSASVTKGTLTATGTWSNVTNVADKTTFTASGNFTGTITDKATGMKALSVSDFTLGDFASMTYSGTEQTPSASVTKGTLTATGTWSKVTSVAEKTTFTASGNFTGTIADKATGMKKAVVSDLDLSALITVPSKNAAAQTTLADQTQYTGNVTWSPALPASGKFLGETTYTATLTLVPTENYTLTGVAENSFTYTGASATNGKNSGTVSLVFAKTGTRVVESIAITGTPTKTIYHLGEAFDAAGITITATYDDGKTAEIKSGYTVSPSAMQGDTTQVTITYADKTATVNGLTVKENLSSIVTPAVITGIANGAAKSTSTLNLPSTVTIVTSKAANATTTATVNWDMDSVTYDPSLLTEQSFTVNGTVALPASITNVDNVSLSVTIAVTVKAANTITKPASDATTNPTDTTEKITGLTDNQKVSPNSILTITADSFIRGDKIYIPVAWKTNPEGTFGVPVGITYSATVNTSGMTTGTHTFTVIYREVKTETDIATGNIVETAIPYTIKSTDGGSTGGHSSTTYYTITATAGAGGNISTGKYVSVREGDSAGFTMIPEKGYVIADVKVNGKSVSAVKNYVFTNVRANHTIEVTFKASSGHVNPQTGVAFEDVSENDWFYDSVYNAVEKGWFAGTSDKTFAPYLSTTRGMIATVLHRMENEPTATAASIFEDVASGAYYTSGVNWAQENSIVSGYGNGKFGPQDNITREQMAAILYRYAQFKGYDMTKTTTLDSFSDADSVSAYAIDPMKWVIANGLVTGKGNGILDPKGEATRAQVAAILTRFDELFSEE